MVLTRDEALALDAADPLAGFRDRFVITDPERIYLDGNSLGRLPVRTRARLHEAIDDWADRLVGGWADWIDAPARAGDVLARVVGARPGEVVVTDSVTVNLYKLIHAVLDADPSLHAVVTTTEDFPTDGYVLCGPSPSPRPSCSWRSTKRGSRRSASGSGRRGTRISAAPTCPSTIPMRGPSAGRSSSGRTWSPTSGAATASAWASRRSTRGSRTCGTRSTVSAAWSSAAITTRWAGNAPG